MNKKSYKFFPLAMILVLLGLAFNLGPNTEPINTVEAASNLVEGGSFESNISRNWTLWSNASSTINYDIYRSYGTENVPFGMGSYSATISSDASGGDRWDAGISTNRNIIVENSADYYLTFYAKTTSTNTTISAYLDDTSSSISNVSNTNIDTNWEKYTVLLTTTSGGSANLNFSFGDIEDGNSLMIDGVSLYKADFTVQTENIRGKIGDNAKIKISGIGMFNSDDIEIELPYLDPVTNSESIIRINPNEIKNNYIYFNYPEGSYAGTGRVLINGSAVGNFTYNVALNVAAIYPEMARADENITVVGTGFHPDIANNVYVIIRAMNSEGRAYEHWARPTHIDSSLTQITFPAPNGIASSKLQVLSSYEDINNVTQTNKSNLLGYKVKPVLYSVEWSEKGYDQVGDYLTISGKGISDSPKVLFYDLDGNLIDSKRGELIEISDYEYIKVKSTTKSNQYEISVECARVESDNSRISTQSASPKLSQIKTSKTRRLQNRERINAASAGETISIKGVSLNSDYTYISFQGSYSSRISVHIDPINITNNGTLLSVVIPQDAISGPVIAIVNGEESNSIAIELVPNIIGYSPTTITPGEGIEITASGIGTQSEISSVVFTTGKNEQSVKPESVWYEAGIGHIYVIAPDNISNSTTINLRYGNWDSISSIEATTAPHINRAGFNEDTKILTIQGYGFSENMKENIITYMYADAEQTVINPKLKVLGLTRNTEGQEIKIQILDDYHYGYISVTVNGQTSNESQFGPVNVSRIARRVEYVESEGRVMGVLYISGHNLGESGGVLVDDVWADVHYRTNFFIIAVVDEADINKNPIIVARD